MFGILFLFEAEVMVSVWGNQKRGKGRSEEGRKKGNKKEKG
jgi:hypothetical protein